MREGWKKTKLNSVVKIVNGGTPNTKVPDYWNGKDLWITPAEMGKLQSPYLSASRRKLSEAGLRNSSASLVPAKSVILSTRAPIGHLVINTSPMAFNQGCRGLICGEQINYKYLYYFLSSKVDLLNELGSGTTFKELSASKLKNVELPLPPLAEQERIIAILDNAFAGIDTAISNTQKNFANARELFESYLNSVFDQRGNGWIEKTIGECFRLKSGDGLTSKQMIPGAFQVFGGNGIAGSHDQYNLSGSNVVIGRVGALCGNARYVNEPIWLTDNAFKIIDKKYLLDNKFLVYMLNFKKLRQYAREAAQPVISNSSLKHIRLSFPMDESKQLEIVKLLDALSHETIRVQSIYQQKLTVLAELKKSLLQKAFSGELTADNIVPATSANKPSVSLNTDSPAFAAHIMAAAYLWHESQSRNKTFGRVKAQKTLHLVEALAQIDLGRAPVKDAAGPNDSAHMRTAEQWAKDQDFYEFVQRPEGQRGYDFVKGKRYGEWLPQALEAIEPYRKTLDKVLKLLMPLDTREAELVATTYAAWNNLLLDDTEVTEAAIIFEARDNWHPDKQKYTKQQFRKAIDRLRSHHMVPNGSGKRVTGQESLR